MPLQRVYSTNGQPRREIAVPGRSPARPFGAIQIQNNVGDRQESDWGGIKAAIAAGSVVICLSGYETDVLPQHLQGTIPYGGNVRFETKKTPSWTLVDDGSFCHFTVLEVHECAHCGERFESDERFTSAFKLGGHVQREHRDIAQRTAAELAG